MTLYKKIYNRLFLDNPYMKIKIGLVFLVISLEIFATAIIPPVRSYFFNVIETKQIGLLLGAMILFFGARALIDLSQIFKTWLVGLVAIGLRNSVTKTFKKVWVKSSKKLTADNPDQRIAEDSRIATDIALSVVVEVFISAVLVILLLFQASVNWMLLLMAGVYVLLSLLVAKIYRKPLVDQEVTVQQSEAKFRRSLVLIHLGKEDFTSKSHLVDVLKQITQYIKVTRSFNIFNRMQISFMSLVPFIVLLPQYFASKITLGDVMSGAAIFELLVINATILIQLYPMVTKAEASWHRLITFYRDVTDG